MNISDLWMRLEALAHLRGLPQYSNIKKEVEAELAEYDKSLALKPVPTTPPKAIPAEPIERKV